MKEAFINKKLPYALVDQYAYSVEHFFKNEAGEWTLNEFEDISDSFRIRSVDTELSLKDIYYRVRYE